MKQQNNFIEGCEVAKIGAFQDKLRGAVKEILTESFKPPSLMDFLKKIVEIGGNTLDTKSFGIFLLDEDGKTLRIIEGTGEIGKDLKRENAKYYVPSRPAFKNKEEREEKIRDYIENDRKGGYSWGERISLIEDGKLPMGITAFVVYSKGMVHLDLEDVINHPEWRGAYEGKQEEVCTSIVEVPLKWGGKVFGMVKIENHKDSPKIKNRKDYENPEIRKKIKLFSKDHENILNILADSIAISLQKSAYRLKLIDPQIILSTIPFKKKKWMPKTGIICTIAPLNKSGRPIKEKEVMDDSIMEKRIEELVDAGMSITRINFSHVISDQQHQNALNLIKIIREVSNRMQRPVGVLMDLCGPRIRTGKVKDGVKIEDGKEYILTIENKEDDGRDLIGDEEKCPITYEDFAKDIKRDLDKKKDIFIFIDDGKLKLKAVDADETDVKCKIIEGGKLQSNKGINIPRCELSVRAVTEKDIGDLEWIFEKEDEEQEIDESFVAVDFVALSFVKNKNDIIILKAFLGAKRRRNLPIIAKIETAEAVDESDDRKEILEELKGTDKEVTGAVMVARGDLAIETSHKEVPKLQTTLITESNEMGIPVIVATQMLESMRENPRPLRSEVTDIVNAVREGADMVMLSGETADGKYPIKSTETMADILREAEEENRIIIHETTKKETTKEDVIKFIVEPPSKPIITTTEAIASPACGMAKIIDSPAIIVCAATGMTAKKCANFRPKQSIIAITRVKETAINLLLYRGVYPVLIKYQPDDTEELLGVIEKILEILDIGKEGDLIVSTFGAEVGVKPLSTTGELKTNTMRILKRGK